MSDWINQPSDINDYQGFVYKITHLPTGRYYIGMKNFWRQVKYPPLKGRQNKRIKRFESNWKEYWGSSPPFDAFREGKDNSEFKREMLHHCKNKFELAYMEMKEQVLQDVLFDQMSFNELIRVRLRKPKESKSLEKPKHLNSS